jgi:branched-subunit amino acid ABC-type transport system permease component
VHDLISAILRGFPIGCVYALVAVGVVLTYKTSGVFNLAFGAQAFVSAAVYFQLHVRDGWPILPAFAVAVVVVAPAVGFVLDWSLFRYLRSAPAVVRHVVTLGLLVALPALVLLVLDFGSSPAFGPKGIVPSGFTVYRLGPYAITRDELATVLVTFVAVGLLTALLRLTTIGLRMRAVVESPRMAELAGVNADRAESYSWMMSGLFAGLAGVLLAPLFPQVSADNFFLLIVAAIAAAAFASLSSLPLALAGGLLLGVGGQLLATELPTGSLLAQGLRPSFPFVVLFLLLILWPGLAGRAEITDPLAGVDPPPPALAAEARSRELTVATRIAAAAAAAAGLWWALSVANAFWLLLVTQAVILSIVFLSVTVITGMAGEISLAQAAFAAIGAFTTAQLAHRFGTPVMVTMVAGAAVAAGVGALLALPAVRLSGLHLTLATLAFALFFENVLVKVDWIGGPNVPLRVPRPVIGPVDFTSDRSFLLLSVLALAVVGVVVMLVRGGTTGRALRALGGSEVAAAAVGINPARARVTAFALSAALAGLGGGLLAVQQGQANYNANFTVGAGLFWIVIVVTLGTRTVEGAVQAGAALRLLPELLKAVGLSLTWHAVIFGLGALTFARHPEGIVEYGKRRSLATVQGLLDRRGGRLTDATPASSALSSGAKAGEPVSAAPRSPGPSTEATR